MSLDTKELGRARRIACDVTFASHRLQADLKIKVIPADVARQILIQVALEKSDWLDAVKSASAGNVELNRCGETASGWAYPLLAAQEREAVIGPTEERDLRQTKLLAPRHVDRVVRRHLFTEIMLFAKQAMRGQTCDMNSGLH